MITITSKNWNDYITYLRLRDKVTDLRCLGLTVDHPYFTTHPSCNNRRYMDRESQYYIINRNNYVGEYPITDAIFQLIFRKNKTYNEVLNKFGDYPGNIIKKYFNEISQFIIEKVDTPFSGAYLIPHRDKKYKTKIEGWLSLFIYTNFESIKTFNAKETCNFFASISGIGDFLSMQFTTELGWLNHTKYGGNEFVIPGNGAVRGLIKLGIPKSHHVKFLQKLVKMQPISHLFYQPMTLMDYQNTFCEFDKFTRYLGGYDNQGRERMKRLRKPHTTPITDFILTSKLKSDLYYKIEFN